MEEPGPISSAVKGAISTGSQMMREKTTELRRNLANVRLRSSENFPLIQLPKGYEIQKVVQGLTYPTSVTWDDEGNMYVAEAGGTFLAEKDASARILRVEDRRTTEVVNLDGKIYPSIVGMVWHNGAFYVTHRELDLSGAVSRVTLDGEVTQILGGIVDSKSDHQPNDIRVGRDGRMYVCVGCGGNSGFMDQNMIAFVKKAPDGHPTVAKDVVLRGVNIEVPNFLKEGAGPILTGAFVPFGQQTTPGQVIKGRKKCGGAILVFDPDRAEATVEPYAWGFRNIVGIAWNKRDELFACVNGYDNAPGRPIADTHDPTYRVREGEWYGWPDFTANLDPVTDPQYQPASSNVAPAYINGERQAREIGFLIDHRASGLQPPDKSLILGLHEINASPSKPDVAPESWGEYADHLFVPEYGDFAWLTNPLRDKYAGSQISVIETGGTGEQRVRTFLQNKEPGPASSQGTLGEGIERPFDVRFGPDGAMYIVDVGSNRVNLDRIAKGHFPVEFDRETGMIWKVTRVDD